MRHLNLYSLSIYSSQVQRHACGLVTPLSYLVEARGYGVEHLLLRCWTGACETCPQPGPRKPCTLRTKGRRPRQHDRMPSGPTQSSCSGSALAPPPTQALDDDNTSLALVWLHQVTRHPCWCPKPRFHQLLTFWLCPVLLQLDIIHIHCLMFRRFLQELPQPRILQRLPLDAGATYTPPFQPSFPSPAPTFRRQACNSPQQQMKLI